MIDTPLGKMPKHRSKNQTKIKSQCAETNTTLSVNYISIKKIKDKEKIA